MNRPGHDTNRLRTFIRGVPVRMGLWLFLPMLLLGFLGQALEGQLAGGKTAGHPSTMHAIKWMLMTFFKPSAADDSWMPMSVAMDVLKGPRASELYQAVFFERKIKFQYPPSSLLPLEPFARLGLLKPELLNGLNSALVALTALITAGFAYRLLRSEKARGPAAGPSAHWVALLTLVAGFSFYPIVQAHTLGQVQVWIDLLFAGACVLWFAGRRSWAGVAIGLACALKPQFALFLPWAIVWRRWDFALGVVACAAPIGLLSLFMYGLPNHLGYLQVLSHLSRVGESFQFNQSANGLMNRLLFNGCNNCPPWQPTALPGYNPLVHYGTSIVTLAFLAVAFVPAFRKKHAPSLLDFGIAALCFTIASPVAWYHHYGILLPLFVLAYASVTREADAAKRRIWLVVLLVCWTLTANYLSVFNLLADTALNPLQSHLFFAAIAFLIVLVRESRRDAPELAFEPKAAGALSPVRQVEEVR